MSRILVFGVLAAVVGMTAAPVTASAAGPRVLFLSSSEAFAHGPIVQVDGKPSVADQSLKALVEKLGGTFTTTKDCSTINAANLKNYDLVIFYTQGDLTKPNKEGAPVMGATGVADLLAWIDAGGGFIGFHSATDTFRSEGPENTPYSAMAGAEFRGHGAQFEGTIKVVDPKHPTMAHVKDGWKPKEEWYLFHKFNTKNMHVLALMDPGEEGQKQEMYKLAPYPVMWCSVSGKGRVYFSALGHIEEMWQTSTFQDTVVDAINWAIGKGEAQANPNFDQVVPK